MKIMYETQDNLLPLNPHLIYLTLASASFKEQGKWLGFGEEGFVGEKRGKERKNERK